MTELTAEKALIFRITHMDNVPWILDHGAHCRSSAVRDPNYREIGNPDLIARRANRVVPVPPGGTLSDYVPFYFTPHSPMLFNIRTGYGGVKQLPMADIAMLVSSVRKLAELGLPFVLTDRHAYLNTAEYSNDLSGLERIDWTILQARDFRRDAENPGKIERYQAETLVHGHAPLTALEAVVCHGPAQKQHLDAHRISGGFSVDLLVKPDWYF